jgi:hypothetical protein
MKEIVDIKFFQELGKDLYQESCNIANIIHYLTGSSKNGYSLIGFCIKEKRKEIEEEVFDILTKYDYGENFVLARDNNKVIEAHQEIKKLLREKYCKELLVYELERER